MSDPTPLPAPGHGVIINGPGPHDWINRYETAGLVALAALPLAALIVGALAWWRTRAGITTRTAWRASVAEVGLVCGTLPWVWLTLLPASKERTDHGSLSLVPLRDLVSMPPYQVVGNLLVLAALGYFGPLRFARLASLPRVLVLAAACSVLIETTQYALHVGRVSSVDDVLLNTAGAGLAALASRRWWRGSRRPAAAAGGDQALENRRLPTTPPPPG
ncbi:VanZ family protein [Mumia sp. DW29H23]|uniref:VanZ family protein n=1 Tax=Mumia sp. DW29H23 TaxID=3421241 RepID=UPI003D68AD02